MHFNIINPHLGLLDPSDFQLTRPPRCMIYIYRSQKLIIQEGYCHLNLHAVRAPAPGPIPLSTLPTQQRSYMNVSPKILNEGVSLRLLNDRKVKDLTFRPAPGYVNWFLQFIQEAMEGSQDLLQNAIASLCL